MIYLEKYRGIDKRMMSREESDLSPEQLTIAIQTIWPNANKTRKDTNGSTVVETWEKESLMKAGLPPEYILIYKITAK